MNMFLWCVMVTNQWFAIVSLQGTFASKTYHQYLNFKASNTESTNHVTVAHSEIETEHVISPVNNAQPQNIIHPKPHRLRLSPRLFRYVVHVTWEKRTAFKPSSFKNFKPDFRFLRRRALPEVVVVWRHHIIIISLCHCVIIISRVWDV